MIEFYVSGQTLKFFTPVIAADSLNYLTAKVNFTDAEWDGYSKWLHFRQDEELGADTYDILLDANNEITADKKLNLTVGQWEIYLTGTKGNSRLTTVPVILTVQESGLIDAPLHELPMSVAEQVDFNASQALLLAQAVKDMADAGEFDGKDGKSFIVKGFYANFAELRDSVTQPGEGDTYGVGSAAPYKYYIWDAVNGIWRDNGSIQGIPGETGAKGATFIPNVDANGNISWTNDGGLNNPAVRNIMGPKGNTGSQGADGKSPYQIAVANGYTGTEATFNAALTNFPYHNARHLPDGADPLIIESGNIPNAAVTRAKLANNALFSPIRRIGTSNTEYYPVATDVGMTYVTVGNGVSYNVNFTEEVSELFASGSEIAIAFCWGNGVNIKCVGNNVVFVTMGGTGQMRDTTLAITERYGMAALKLVNIQAGVYYWLVTGNVEVVG